MKHFIDRFSDTRIFVLKNEAGFTCGKILAKWSNSGVCTVGACIWEDNCRIDFSKTKKAGGYGYDKMSNAFCSLILEHFGIRLKDCGYQESIEEFAAHFNLKAEQIL